MATGISSVTGNRLPKIDEENFYEVSGFYPGTAVPTNESDIKWKLFVEESTGNWRELRGAQKTGRKVPFSFPQQWYGKKLLIEAYLHNSEKKSPPGIIVMPVGGERKINKISFFDSNWKAIQQTPKYGQTLNVRIETVNMLGETLRVSLWERDTYSDTGHDPNDNVNIWGSERSFKVENTNGKIEFPMMLNPSWAILAGRSIFEGSEHEYYLLVKGFGATTKFSTQRNVSNEVVPVERPPNRPSAPPVPAAPNRTPGISPTPNSTPAPAHPQPANTHNQEPVRVGGTGIDPPAPSGGVSPAVVNEVKVEGIIDAYFAKKEFTKKTGEEASTFEYPIASNGNRTATDAEKDRIAGIILDKPAVKALKDKKEYTTKEAIKAGLVLNVYNNTDKVTFKTFKLGEEFKKIPSAPLEDKVYLVATSYFLEGKTATIIVKEKDGIIGGAADAVLPISQISEEKMASTEALVEADRTEKTEFTGTIEKIEVGKDAEGNPVTQEMVRIPVQLSPKTDADLKIWRDKLAKGKKDADYTYKFGGTNNISDEAGKKTVAAAILRNIKSGNAKNTKLADGIIAYEEDIIKALEVKNYVADDEVAFATYKKVPELLWLNAKASGEKEHNKDFLKSEGKYFIIEKKCICEERIRAFLRMLRVGEGTGELIKSRDKQTKEIIYVNYDFDKGYTTAFGNNLITDLSDHPRINYGGSTAAGAYQVMKDTWDDSQYSSKKTLYHIDSFSKENQDKFSVLLMKHHPGCSDLLSLLLSGQTENSIRGRASRIWASLPEVGDNSRYLFNGVPQPVTPMKVNLEHFEKFLLEELAGNSPLYLKKGFLNEFNIPCNCGNNSEKNSDWHHPLDRMELRGWYEEIHWLPGKSDFHGRTGGKHDGLDLYAPVGTTIYAVVGGTLTYLLDAGGYGHRTFLEGDYKGKKYYFMYCHLSEYITGQVKAGDPIGKTGQSGNAGGHKKMAHLHFEVRAEKMSKPDFNPLTEISELGKDVIINPVKENQTGD